MSMIRDALEWLNEVSLAASSLKPIATDDPRKLSFYTDGQVITCDLPKPPREHTIECLSEVGKIAIRFAAEDPVVWVGESAVVVVIDDGGHRLETATLALETSDVFDRLCQLRDDPRSAWMNQKDFVRLLRIDLAGTLDPVVLLNAVRQIRWSSQTDSTVNRQRESLGSEISARCADGKDLPEEVDLRVPVYVTDECSVIAKITCSVDVDPSEGKLRLLPLPDAINSARSWALAQLANAICLDLTDAGLDSTPAVYRGQP